MRPHPARLLLLSLALTTGCTGGVAGGDPTLETPFDDTAFGPELDPELRPGGGDPGRFNDRDGDGLADVEEVDSDAGSVDTDGDGIDDLVETAYDRAFCRTDAGACKCAASAVCEPPPDFIAVVLPYGDDAAIEIELEAVHREADVFFLLDTTASMAGAFDTFVSALRDQDAMERIGGAADDVQIGLGRHADLPFGGYGADGDRLLHIEQASTRFWHNSVRRRLDQMSPGGAGDAADGQMEAIFQLATGAGGEFYSSAATSLYRVPAFGADCPEGTFGAACFRDDALPVIVHVTDSCSHGGPADDSGECLAHDIVSPARSYQDMVDVLAGHGVRYVGLNASDYRCKDDLSPRGSAPCHFLATTAEATGSRDYNGELLVNDLPVDDPVLAAGMIADMATRAIRSIPFDVHAVARTSIEEPSRAILNGLNTACASGADGCWTAPAGLPQERAVAAVDASTFYGTVPGTVVRYTLVLDNDRLEPDDRSQHLTIDIELEGDGRLLDHRPVHVIIPARR